MAQPVPSSAAHPSKGAAELATTALVGSTNWKTGDTIIRVGEQWQEPQEVSAT